jgi:aryl-alcohol dehydrogenase-like predicted oxidoreductase
LPWDLVQAGKIRHYGFSDVPAWYASRAQTIAEYDGKDRLIALQLEYSLVERNIEREHVPAAQELGLGICPWSPLASGFLTGKYRPENVETGGWRFEK